MRNWAPFRLRVARGAANVGIAVLSTGLASAAAAQTVLPALEVSPTTTLKLGAAILGPEEVGEDDLIGGFSFTGVGVPIRLGVDVGGFHRFSNGDTLFAVDVTTDLGGGVVARPGDVAMVASGTPSIAFSSSANGIPTGARIDAVGSAADGSLLLSFDTTVSVGGTVFADEDVARFPVVGSPSVAFDGSAAGVRVELDVDAVDELDNGHLLLSFDTTGKLGSVVFADEDLVEFDPVAQTFVLAYDGSAQDGSWRASDLDAADAPGDLDQDGVADRDDNCAHVSNPLQADQGGVGFGSAPDGVGDACQCGDVSGDGFVTTADSLIIRRSLLQPPTATAAQPQLCNVGGSAGCSTADALIIRRALLTPPTATVQQLCAPALP